MYLMTVPTAIAKLKVAVINLIVFDVDKHSSPSTSSREPSISPTKPYKLVSTTSTQIADEGIKNPTPRELGVEVGFYRKIVFKYLYM